MAITQAGKPVGLCRGREADRARTCSLAERRQWQGDLVLGTEDTGGDTDLGKKMRRLPGAWRSTHMIWAGHTNLGRWVVTGAVRQMKSSKGNMWVEKSREQSPDCLWHLWSSVDKAKRIHWDYQ